MTGKRFRALGMISGTSIDGIDTALIETDGQDHVRSLGFMPHSYEPEFRERLRACLGNALGLRDPSVAAFADDLTDMHASLVQRFLEQNNLAIGDIDVIGFHGQTILHKPEERRTLQIGDGARLAALTGIPVVGDFRSADVEAGGHGAPLVPLYHRALAVDVPKPVAIVNIGGVSNMTWIGYGGEHDLLAFDLGPGNALVDDWVFSHTGLPYDADGELARAGEPDMAFVARFLEHPYFVVKPPKSLDRDAFRGFIPEDVGVAEGAATLTMMTASAIAAGLRHVPEAPRAIYLAGGGRLNRTLARWIGEQTGVPVDSVDGLGWSGDGLEAEAFGYLAVRSIQGMPLSVPGTTGVPTPMTGGRYFPVPRTV